MAPPAQSSRRNLRGFIRWMRDNNIEYSDALSFHIGDTVADIGVKALSDLHEGDMIATIPKQTCLTILTSEAAEMIAEAELGGGLGLAVAFMYERSRGELSKWYGYLQLLPFQQCLPFVWSLAEIDRLLVGTELHKVIKEDRQLMKEDWRECYGILCELFGEDKFPLKWFSFDHYLAAKTLVDSRAFEVDEEHGHGMVPLADLFNHKTAAEDVHFTSVLSDSDSDSDTDTEQTVDVPKKHEEEKGKPQQNTEEENSNSAGSPSDWEGSSDVLEMILVKDVVVGSEIYNTYGYISNAALLHRYGFTELHNPFDIVNVDLATVSDVCRRSLSTRHVRRCVTLWRKAGCAPCTSQGSEYFEISASGRPQPELLLLLYIIHLPDATRDKLEQETVGMESEVGDSSNGVEGAESVAVEGLARELGWTSGLEAKGGSRKRARGTHARVMTETSAGSTQNGSNKHARPRRASVAAMEEDPSWLTDLDKWLLTKPVCTSLLAVVTERDGLYPGVDSMTSEKVTGTLASSSLEHDSALLQNLDCKADAKLYHALALRVSERTILAICAAFLSLRLKRMR